MIVVDASVLVTALGGDGPDGSRLRRRLVGEALAAPHLLDIEVAAAWRRLVQAGRLDEQRARRALGSLAALQVDRVPHGPLVDRCWALRENLTVYDASYVALAELLEVVLVTADGRLARAPGIRCAVEVV